MKTGQKTIKILNQKAFWALLIVYAVWGTTMAAIHYGVESIPPLLLACIRFLLAGGILILIAIWRGELWPSKRETLHHGVIGLMLFFGGNALSCWALQTLSTGLAGMIIATTPFWMLTMSHFFEGKLKGMPKRDSGSPQLTVLWSMGLALLGIMILLSPQLQAPELTSSMFWWSLLAMLVLCWFWSAGSLYAKHHQGEASVWMALGIQNLIAGLLLAPICYALGNFQTLSFSRSSLWALGYLVVFGTIVTTPCYYYVLKHLPVSISSSFAFVNPVITILVGTLFLGEVMTIESWVGSAIVVVAVILLQWASKPSEENDTFLKNKKKHTLVEN